MASFMLRWRASFVPWQAIFTPFMSCVMLSYNVERWWIFQLLNKIVANNEVSLVRKSQILTFTCVDEIFPPQRPGWLVTPFSLIRGIPSLYQASRTGGLLELESQNRLASVPAVNAFGSTRIFKVSGRTVKKKEKSFLLRDRMGEKHHHNDDNEGRKRKHWGKFSKAQESERDFEEKVADRTE